MTIEKIIILSILLVVRRTLIQNRQENSTGINRVGNGK